MKSIKRQMTFAKSAPKINKSERRWCSACVESGEWRDNPGVELIGVGETWRHVSVLPARSGGMAIGGVIHDTEECLAKWQQQQVAAREKFLAKFPEFA